MSTHISELMMLNLADAWDDGRLRISSNGSIFKSPDVNFVNRKIMHISTVDDRFKCSLTSGSEIILQTNGICVNIDVITLNANSFGETGVWIQIENNRGNFWLEIYAPTPTTRQLQSRPHFNSSLTSKLCSK